MLLLDQDHKNFPTWSSLPVNCLEREVAKDSELFASLVQLNLRIIVPMAWVFMKEFVPIDKLFSRMVISVKLWSAVNELFCFTKSSLLLKILFSFLFFLCHFERQRKCVLF